MRLYRILHPFRTRRARRLAEINRYDPTASDLARWADEDRQVAERLAS